MPRNPSDKRERLTAAAIRLARTQGLEATTIAAIAAEADVPSGSVYYYFKTKDDVASAIVDGIAAALASQGADHANGSDARDALTAFLSSYLDDTDTTVQYGTVLSAAARVGSGAAHAQVLGWLAERFEDLGFAASAASARAQHLLAGVEGGAALASALGDAQPLEREVAHLTRWVANAKA
ncbi:TetR/AcrR family transcriptional regulator [Demequina flava]|uniref:TetR/AcrR family transcriptional regulator n=1 Tax=Demequina flava TaxID=1095025 RepID=UPI000785854B|nr:TetR/AcrR family transcriptional regulator [Demequina flava]